MTHDDNVIYFSRHESSLPNKFVNRLKVIEAVTTPDFIPFSFPIVYLSGMFSALFFSISSKIWFKDYVNA